MPVGRVRGRLVLGVAAALLASGCAHGDEDPSPASPQSSPSVGTRSPSSSGTVPSGGTSAAPASVTATTDLLDWSDAPGAVEDTVATNGTATLTVDRSGSSYTLDGPGGTTRHPAPDGLRISDALIDARWAVVVAQDSRENAVNPDHADVIDLATGKSSAIDGRSSVPTTTGGTWALGGDLLVHATVGPRRSYCLATIDLSAGTANRAWCVPARHGFNAAHVTSAGVTVLSFDDSQPSCRTVGVVGGLNFTPFTGVASCKAWEGALLTPDSAVWSVIPQENRVEQADFQARVGTDFFDLGPGTSGTLVPCHDAAYFVRDPQRDGEPASLMRWDGHTLATVYQAPPGQSFLEAPRCGDDAITVTALSEGGDEQVTAPLE